MSKSKTIIGLIPARAGSKRVRKKNIRKLNGHPLIAYTISAALRSKIFTNVIVSTECEETAAIAKHYGADVPFLRPQKFAQDNSPDIDWIVHVLTELRGKDILPEYFSILRPTSPFRQPETICRAWEEFKQFDKVDSLRAVELCSQHPGKMWYVRGENLEPVMQNPNSEQTPWHSSPYQSLPEIYIQNASLEIAKCSVPMDTKTIAGKIIAPFITSGYEGFDINLPEDWLLAEALIENKLCELPSILE